MTIDELIEKLEKAETGSRELDAHIRLALIVNDENAYVKQSEYNGEWCIYSGEWQGRPRLYENRDRSINTSLWRGEYTASLDAAVMLAERVLPGWRWGVTQGNTPEDDFQGNVWPGVQPYPADLDMFGYHKSAPLALCLAIIKAVQEPRP